MTTTHRFARIVSCLALGISVACAAVLADAGPTRYRIEDLGTFGGPDGCEEGVFPTWAAALGLNESGHTVGWAERSEQLLDPDTGEPLFYPDTGDAVCTWSSHPSLWRNGEIVDLGALHEGGSAVALGLNDHDHVVGGASTDNNIHPFLWTEDSGMVDLMADSAFFGEATAINNFGEITINADESYFRDADGNLRVLRFPDSPVPGFMITALDINDDGIVVGSAPREEAYGAFHAFRYDSRADTIEDIHDPFYFESFGYGLNEDGDIAFETTAYTWHVFSSVLTHDGNLVVLPLGNMRFRGELRPDLLRGGIDDVNAHGDVIGADVSVVPPRLVLPWVAFDVLGDGPIQKIPLEDLLSPEDRAEWELWFVWGLNDARQIVGYAGHNGKARAFLMTPEESASGGYAGLQATTEGVPGGEPSRVEIETAARLEAVARVVPDSLGPNRAVGMLRPRPSIEPRESDGVRNMEPASGPDGSASRISRPAPRSIPRGTTSGDGLQPLDRNHDPADDPRQPGPDRSSRTTTRDDG